jgi:hypothetical protein
MWLWLDADNARPHTAEVWTDYFPRNEMKRAPHPPDSPDLAPANFFLFGYVKIKVMGYRAESESELRVRIRVTLAEIPRDVLNAVFLEWMDRVQKWIETNGDYVGCVKKHQSSKPFLFGRFLVAPVGVGQPISWLNTTSASSFVGACWFSRKWNRLCSAKL